MEKEKVLDYFRREKIYQRLNTIVSFLLKKGDKVNFQLKVGGGSFTDGETITVGLPEIFVSKSKPEIFSALKALVAHESSHIVDSDFKVMKEYLEESTNYLMKEYNISKSTSKDIAHHIFNSIEDGRIERRLVNRLKGTKKHIQFLNLSFWDVNEPQNNELKDFLFTITSLAVVGMEMKGFNEMYKGTRAVDEINKIKSLIDLGIKQNTCRDCANVCMKILKAIFPYVIAILKDNDNLNDLNNNTEYSTSPSNSSEENDVECTTSAHPNVSEDNKEKDNNKDKNDDNDNTSGDTGKDKKDNKEDDKKGKGKGNSKEEEKEDKDKSENESNGGKGKEENKEQDNNKDSKANKDDKDNKDEDDKDSKDGKDSNSKKNKDDNKSNDEKSSNNENTGISEEKIREILREIEKEVIKEGTPIIERIDKSDEMELKRKQKKDEEEQGCRISFEDISKINEKATTHVIFNEFQIPQDNFETLRGDSFKKSRVLKREIEKIFKSKREVNFKFQRRGTLDCSSLWRIGVNQNDIFNQKKVPNIDDYVFYILVDGSGSMRGTKINEAMNSCAILEESIKEFIPFKISVFSGDYDRVNHIKIKGFTDKPKKYNMALSSLNYDIAHNSNNDGYSIRVATTELLKRNEKNKILIVLSDGLPSANSFGYRNIEDVKYAVQQSRKQGIDVFSIFFGSEGDRERHVDSYRYMYEKNIISSKPEDISKNLIKLFKKTFFR